MEVIVKEIKNLKISKAVGQIFAVILDVMIARRFISKRGEFAKIAEVTYEVLTNKLLGKTELTYKEYIDWMNLIKELDRSKDKDVYALAIHLMTGDEEIRILNSGRQMELFKLLSNIAPIIGALIFYLGAMK